MSNVSSSIAKLAYEALDSKKAENIKIIDISNVSVIADYFVIADATNMSQLQAMCDNVREKLALNEISPKHIEGYDSANWILLDYNDVIIHLFDKESRSFYDLERIWSDGTEITSF